MTRPLYAGIDLGGTHTRFCLYQDGQFLVSEKCKTAAIISGDRPIEALVAWVAARLAAHGAHPRLLAIGLPVTLDRVRRTILSSPNVPALNGIAIVDILQAALQIPVIAERDVNFQFFHDLHTGGIPCKVGMGVYIGTGIGNAVWINGFYAGAHGSAAELGHIPVNGALGVCGCGKIGCAETVCCGRWLGTWQQRHAPGTAITDLFEVHGDHPDLRTFVDIAAQVIATGLNLFDPDLMFLGGGVLELAGFPRERLLEQTRRHIRAPFPRDGLEIRLASHLSDSGARGACLYAEHSDKESVAP
ncbi:MAG: allose kinase [Azospirillaceae bacterium]|nr:allose kinase [Azospirillaceae bacterium]